MRRKSSSPAAPPPRTSDWLNATPEDFIRRYAPHAAPPPAPPQLDDGARRVAFGARLLAAAAIKAPASSETPEPDTGTHHDMTQLTPEEIAWAMAHSEEIIASPLHGGRRMPAHEVLKAHFANTGQSVNIKDPDATGSAPSGQPSAIPSQRAFDALSKDQYDQLAETGDLNGLLRRPESTVTVRSHDNSGVSQRFFRLENRGDISPAAGPDYGTNGDRSGAKPTSNPWRLLDR